MLQVNQLFGFGVGVAAVSPSYVTSASSTSDLTVYTFSSQSLGAAASDRKIILGVGTRSDRNVSSCTIGGVTATKVLEYRQTGDSNTSTILIADVPTGSTGDVVVTLSGSGALCGISIYRVTGLLSSTAHATAVDGTGNPSSINVNVPAGGFAVGVVTVEATSGTITWVGIDENYDAVIDAFMPFSTAFKFFSGAQTPLNVTASHSGGNTKHSLVVASWGN